MTEKEKPDRKKVVIGCVILTIGALLALLALLAVIGAFLPKTPKPLATAENESAKDARVAETPVRDPAKPREEPVAATVPELQPKLAVPAGPDLRALYSVTQDDDLAGLNRKVDVTLYHRQPQAIVEAVCNQLHSGDQHTHETTFIHIDVLNEPAPRGMAHWAMAEFSPALSLNILGEQ